MTQKTKKSASEQLENRGYIIVLTTKNAQNF